MSSQPTEPSGPTDLTPSSSGAFSPASPASYPDATAAPVQDGPGFDVPPAAAGATPPTAPAPMPDARSPQPQQPAYAQGYGQAPVADQPASGQQSPWGGSPVAGQPPLGQPHVYGNPTPYAGRGGDTPRKAAAKRTMLLGVLWFAAGIVVSVVTIAMGTHGVIFWGLSLYGVFQIVRGAIAYGKA